MSEFSRSATGVSGHWRHRSGGVFLWTPTARVETHFRIRHDKGSKLTLRYESRLLHIDMGARHKGLPVVMLIADRDVRVVSAADGELVRHLTLDPARNYQRQSA